MDVLGHNGNMLCMDHAEVGILQDAGQVVLCSFLQSHICMQLEVQVISSNILGYFADEMQEGALVFEELSALLVLSLPGTSRAS